MTQAKALRLDDLDLALEPFMLRSSGGNETLFFLLLAAAMLFFAVLI